MNDNKTKKILFQFTAKNISNIKISGITESYDISAARHYLEKKGYIDIKIKKKPAALFQTKIRTKDITDFTRQLSIMINAGIPIIRGLDVIVNGIKKNDNLKAIISNIRSVVESGQSLSEALQQHPKYFDKLYVSLIKTGEYSGTLDTMLDKIALQREHREKIIKKVKKALTYPIAVLGVAILVSFILLVYAVPAFSKIFLASGNPLPAVTRITVNTSDFVQLYWIHLVAIIASIIALFKYAKRYSIFNKKIDLYLLKIPIIGVIITKSSFARFAQTMQITVSSGMHLVDALDSVATATGNWKYEKATLEMKKHITEGNSIFEAAQKTNAFPELMLQMLAIGEESGSLEIMLANLAEIYNDEVDLMVSSLSSLLEPFIMIILGGLVGFLVISMYLPMFQMGDNF